MRIPPWGRPCFAKNFIPLGLSERSEESTSAKRELLHAT